jgi:UDP-3-O-[3-hydroxymyristoyl] glucosamine N-acyltransferase
MEKTLQELTSFLKGTLENDDPQLKITGVNGLVEAGPKDISFAVPPYVEVCHKSRAGRDDFGAWRSRPHGQTGY